MAEHVRRDDYLRSDLFRERVTVPNEKEDVGCAFCGGVKYRNRKTGGASMYLYKYYWHSDNMKVTQDTHLFCSTTCRNNFMEY